MEQPESVKNFVYTKKADLILPEYGRHIHILVEHALTIQDRTERTKCAKSIIAVMGNLFPHLRDVPDFNHKLWDHLAIMSDFKLDIDTPFPLPDKATLIQPPAKVPYPVNNIKIKHYGRVVTEMIECAIKEQDPVKKKALVTMIGNHMKKSLAQWNKDQVNDDRIFNDIRFLSQNRLEIPEGIRFVEAREIRENRPPSSQNKQGHDSQNNNNSNRSSHHSFKKSNNGPKRFDDRRNNPNPNRPH